MSDGLSYVHGGVRGAADRRDDRRAFRPRRRRWRRAAGADRPRTRTCAGPTRELLARVDAFAAGLLALGLEPGDRVGIWSPNNAEWVVTQFATAKAGLILVNINPAYRAHELEYALNKVGLPGADPAPPVQDQRLSRRCCDELAPELARRAPGQLARRAPARAAARRSRSAASTRRARCASTSRGTRRRRRAGAPGRARRAAAVRRPDQHPVHQRHHRPAQGRHAHPPQHPQQRLLHRRGACGSSPSDRLCIPVPLYHCFGMVLGNLACLTHGSAMVYPGEGFDPLATLRDRRGGALHGALRRAHHVHRRARTIPSSRASTSPRCAPASWPARPARSR